jgi:glutathione peroxidase
MNLVPPPRLGHNGLLKGALIEKRGVAMIDRRTMITAALAAIAGPVARPDAPWRKPHEPDHRLCFSFPALAGGDIRLADYAGRPLLVVNTASLCGFTPQYAGLQELWTEFRDRGLMIIGVPSNDFGGQEPGGATEIAQTAQHQYGVTFPIAAKAVVKGPNAHPFYKWAAEARPKDVPQPPCANPDALGVSRTVEIDTTGGPGFGFEHFKQLDFLRDKEVVLTFDDGPWPTTRRPC